MNPCLVHSARDWQVWDKPSGWTVHNESPSLLEHLQKQKPRTDFHFLNRLDRDTSGLVVVTESAAPIPDLQKAWQDESTTKMYLGIHRRPRDFQLQPQIWNQALTDKAEGRKNPQGLSNDRHACETHFIPLAQTDHLVLSLLSLRTGRQHQIRKHSVLNRMELVGDSRYGDPRYSERLRAHLGDLRLALHATFLQWSPGHQGHQGPAERIFSPAPPFFRALFSEVDALLAERLAIPSTGL